MAGSTAARFSIGGRSTGSGDKQILVLDDSYAAQRIGNAIIYGGYITHWWGPGWISALSLSNNARPIPQIGISRIDTSAFSTPWLHWLGPWQAEFFVGVLTGPRLATNTIYDGLKLTFNPLPGLELGISRTDEMCGSGHPCSPLSDYFHLQNNPNNPNQINDELQMDARYTGRIGKIPFEIYGSIMDEDGGNPQQLIIHGVTSHQAGASIWIPVGANNARVTIEYTDTVPTENIFGGPLDYGDAYNNGGSPDGMRYRGRTLGFSLDSDSKLLSLQASVVNSEGVTWTFTYHHANVSDRENFLGNAVTTSPVLINLGEAKVSIPMSRASLSIAARVQDDQPRPHKGFTAAGEMALKFQL